MKQRPLLALDGDGVLLDYLEGYAEAWREAFGTRPAVRDPFGYGPLERFEVPRLDAEGRARFRKHFGTKFWSSVPAIPGAVEASVHLHDAGFELVCVTALDAEFEASRLKNLRALGYPIERVCATPHDGGHAPGSKRPRKAHVHTESRGLLLLPVLMEVLVRHRRSACCLARHVQAHDRPRLFGRPAAACRVYL